MLFKKIRGEDLVYLLNEHGIYVSSGSACSSHNMRPSHVLKAMGYSDEEASSCVRFTIDNSISNEEIDHVIKTVHTIIKLIRNG
jgi:cysteine desulfurase